jgi:hypothetical protein
MALPGDVSRRLTERVFGEEGQRQSACHAGFWVAAYGKGRGDRGSVRCRPCLLRALVDSEALLSCNADDAKSEGPGLIPLNPRALGVAAAFGGRSALSLCLPRRTLSSAACGGAVGPATFSAVQLPMVRHLAMRVPQMRPRAGVLPRRPVRRALSASISARGRPTLSAQSQRRTASCSAAKAIPEAPTNAACWRTRDASGFRYGRGRLHSAGKHPNKRAEVFR